MLISESIILKQWNYRIFWVIFSSSSLMTCYSSSLSRNNKYISPDASFHQSFNRLPVAPLHRETANPVTPQLSQLNGSKVQLQTGKHIIVKVKWRRKNNYPSRRHSIDNCWMAIWREYQRHLLVRPAFTVHLGVSWLAMLDFTLSKNIDAVTAKLGINAKPCVTCFHPLQREQLIANAHMAEPRCKAGPALRISAVLLDHHFPRN